MLTEKYIEFLIDFEPEYASKIGFRHADVKISSYTESWFKLKQVRLQKLIQLAKKADTSDSSILLSHVHTEYKLNQLLHDYKVPYTNIFYVMYKGIQSLPTDSVHVRTRLRAYAGYDNHIPLAVQLQEWIHERFELTFPFYKEIEKDLDSAHIYIDYINSQCHVYPEWNVLRDQLYQFRHFLIQVVKPHTILTYTIPMPLYQHVLLHYGIHTPIHNLLHHAYRDMHVIQKEIHELVHVISKRNHIKPYYKDVLHFIQSKPIPNDQIVSYYQQRLMDIEHILVSQRILNVPDIPCTMRKATPEEDVIPIPRYERPSVLHSTSRGAFIIPSTISTEDKTEAGSWTLLAHETRPGHELHVNRFQRHSMIEKLCGWRPAYTEGWALYAEYIMYPYIPIEAQFMSLKMRWLRVARTILDITLHMGHMTTSDALHYLIDTIGLSEPMANSEIDRMTFLSPGQSVSYYAGFHMILAKRDAYFGQFPHASLYDFHEWVLECSPEQWH
jgi:hypothetical protein